MEASRFERRAGFRGWISGLVIHHIAGYRGAVRLRRGTAYRGAHCVVAGYGISGATARVVTQTGGVRDRMRYIALVDATGEQDIR